MALKTKQKLKEMFNYLNKKYWDNKLTPVNIHVKEIKNCYGEYEEPGSPENDKPENYHITINARMHWRNKRSIRSTLLHEMCHHAIFIQNKTKYWNNEIMWHGKEWRREMERVGFKKPVRKWT